MKRLFLLFAFTLFLTAGSAVFHTATAQCPMCKTSLEANRKDNEAKVGNGINKGILYLLAMPFLMVGGVGGAYIYRLRRR